MPGARLSDGAVPVNFRTAAERERLGRFPTARNDAEARACFTLSAADRAFVLAQRGDQHRLGCALQLGALRALGCCPADLTTAPVAVVAYLAAQRGVSPAALAHDGRRAQTRTDHQRAVQASLGFRAAGPAERDALAAWLVARALEHDRPTLLFQLAAEQRAADKVVRPGVTRLARLVATARERAQAETFHRLAPVLTPACCARLDQLRTPDPVTGRTPLIWLPARRAPSLPRSRSATSCAPGAPGAWTPRCCRRTAGSSWRSWGRAPQALARAPGERRYPLLLAFLRQAHAALTDEAILLFDRGLAGAEARARQGLDACRQSVAQLLDERVRLFDTLGRIILDPAVADADVRATVSARLPPGYLRAAVEGDARLTGLTHLAFLDRGYGYLRQFVPAFLAAFTFRSHRDDDAVLAAVAVLRAMHRAPRARLPPDVPQRFVTARWRPDVFAPEGAIDRRYDELCALWALRGALRAGNVWLPGSRRYADPASYLIPRERWPAPRAEVCRLLGAPADGSVRLGARADDRAARHAALEALLARDEPGGVRRVDRRLVVPPRSAEDVPARVAWLREQIGARLPRVELADLLVEVDGWTGFTHALEHASGGAPRAAAVQPQRYAAILAQACTLGLAATATSADRSYGQLAWCAIWHLREETRGAASAVLVNDQYRQPRSQTWGGGTRSSSDGQRCPVAVRAANAA